MRRYLGTSTPALWVSVSFVVFAFAVDILVPLSARSVEMVRCMDGWTNLNSNRVPLTAMVIVPTLLALWRAVLHVAVDRSMRRRRTALAVIVALVAAATGGVVAVSEILQARLPDGFTIGGGC